MRKPFSNVLPGVEALIRILPAPVRAGPPQNQADCVAACCARLVRRRAGGGYCQTSNRSMQA
jgi:hypothetical protein